jgi:hypothetical protein
MGTEHNTPEMIPLTCDTRGKKPLSPAMKQVAYEGACVVAAHQYFRSKGGEGYSGKLLSKEDLDYLSGLEMLLSISGIKHKEQNHEYNCRTG